MCRTEYSKEAQILYANVQKIYAEAKARPALPRPVFRTPHVEQALSQIPWLVQEYNQALAQADPKRLDNATDSLQAAMNVVEAWAALGPFKSTLNDTENGFIEDIKAIIAEQKITLSDGYSGMQRIFNDLADSIPDGPFAESEKRELNTWLQTKEAQLQQQGWHVYPLTLGSDNRENADSIRASANARLMAAFNDEMRAKYTAQATEAEARGDCETAIACYNRLDVISMADRERVWSVRPIGALADIKIEPSVDIAERCWKAAQEASRQVALLSPAPPQTSSSSAAASSSTQNSTGSLSLEPSLAWIPGEKPERQAQRVFDAMKTQPGKDPGLKIGLIYSANQNQSKTLMADCRPGGTAAEWNKIKNQIVQQISNTPSLEQSRVKANEFKAAIDMHRNTLHGFFSKSTNTTKIVEALLDEKEKQSGPK